MREALAWLLRSRRLLSERFASAEDFDALLEAGFAAGAALLPAAGRAHARHERPGAVRALAERGLAEAMPVIFLTGHADVPTAVDMVKRGAFDFCEKPFSDNALVDRVEQALQQSAAGAGRAARAQPGCRRGWPS